MPANFVNEDLRSRKTEKALYAAMFSLLRKTSFRKITIKGICEEAFVSRAAFYAHFIDKYDLLKRWMVELWPSSPGADTAYEQFERSVNEHIQENAPIIKNLVYDADNETFGILFDALITSINLCVERGEMGEDYPKNIVLANFFAGGTISYILWQVKNKFPPDVPLMNRHFYEMIHELRDWQSR